MSAKDTAALQWISQQDQLDAEIVDDLARFGDAQLMEAQRCAAVDDLEGLARQLSASFVCDLAFCALSHEAHRRYVEQREASA